MYLFDDLKYLIDQISLENKILQYFFFKKSFSFSFLLLLFSMIQYHSDA